ncbi:hypothetical protein AAULR_19306 [Lacticaseibacillus rhamnosus MTCC 5462]|nr:hypothetical protein AAULR_19306 [Lacticaseibacillus rhamnosus MTCC 5462]
MRKSDWFILALTLIEMLATFLLRDSLSLVMLVFLVILIPLVLMAFFGGRVLFHYNDKFSFFNTFVVAATSTIISLPFSMIFPWQAVIEEGSIIRVNPNISAITSTLIIQYLLVSVVFLFCSLLSKNK